MNGRSGGGEVAGTTALWRRGLVLLPLAFLGAFFLYPLFTLAGRVLLRPGELLWPVVTDAYFQRIVLFTVKQALYSTLLSVIVGFPLAFLFSRYDFPLKRLFRSLSLVPFVLPPITVALGFILMFGNNGVLNGWLFDHFGFRIPVLYSLTGIVLAHAFYNAPVVMRTVMASWNQLDPSLEESARTLGGGRLSAFKDVTLPMLVPGIATGAALAFIFSFLSFPLVLALGGARFSTLEVEIYTQVRVLSNADLGAALALVQIGVSLLFAIGYLWLERRYGYQVRSVRPRPTLPLLRWGGGRALLGAMLLPIAVLYLGPILSIVYHSLQPSSVGMRGGPGLAGAATSGSRWSLDGYRSIFSSGYDATLGDSPVQSIVNSLSYGTVTALVALVIGGMVAFAAARGRTGRGAWLELLAMAPVAISSVALGYGLLRAFNRPPFDVAGTGAAIVIAYIVLAIPFVVRTLKPELAALPDSFVESARSLGASRLQALVHIELPLVATGLMSGALLAFSMSIAEMSATAMLSRPGFSTMTVTLYQLLSARRFTTASAMAVVLMGITGLSFILIEGLGRRLLARRRSGRGRALRRSGRGPSGAEAPPEERGRMYAN